MNLLFQRIASTTTTTTTEASPTDVDNPCSLYKPPKKPNFKVGGRRISEAKCYEYIWNMKTRQEYYARQQECDKILEAKRKMGILVAIPVIYNGRSTSEGEFPHMGAVGWRTVSDTWIFKCGSSLISPKFVLTAGHCTRTREDPMLKDTVPKIIRLGDKNILDIVVDGQRPLDVNIKKIIPHPSYKPPEKYNDIALMELDHEVYPTRLIQPACLWRDFDTSSLGTTATITGWGVVEDTQKTTPELQAADVDIIDSSICQQLLQYYKNRHWRRLNESQICAGKLAGGTDACQGDSGGPLQVKINLPIEKEGLLHYVIGVTSFGIGCGRANLPGVYTRVSSYIDWIESIVWPNE